MLLTITTTHQPATDLGFLLHKHPDKLQSFKLPFGQAHVYFPEATQTRCTAALLLDIDPRCTDSARTQRHLCTQTLCQRPALCDLFVYERGAGQSFE